MAESDKDKTQRRVYVLPSDLVDRISQFQKEMGLPSEVEAARRLLDEALKHRDTPEDIIRRFTRQMRETKVLSDIAKDVLVGHPKVLSIQFDGPTVKVVLSQGEEISFYGHGGGRLKRGYGDPVKFDNSGILDDEIPF